MIFSRLDVSASYYDIKNNIDVAKTKLHLVANCINTAGTAEINACGEGERSSSSTNLEVGDSAHEARCSLDVG